MTCGMFGSAGLHYMPIIVPNGFEPNYTVGFVKGLSANGVKPCVISSDTEHVRLLEKGVRSVNLRGSQEESRPALLKSANMLRYYARLVLYLLNHRNSVVHFTGLFRNEIILFEGVILNLCLRAISARYLYTAHNVLPHSRENSRFFKWVYRVAYTIPHKIIVHTQLAKQQLVQQFSVPPCKIAVISIGLNEEMPVSDMTRVHAREFLGYTERDRVILFFGKADEYKGLDTLIAAFDRLESASIKLLIAGWFPNPSYRRKVIALLGSARRKADIRLHEEFIPNEEVEVFFKSADVLALPHRHIYQSGVVFLGFRFGVPIVATDVGSMREFIEEDMGIIARTLDAGGFADALRQFFETHDRFRREDIVLKAQKYKWGERCKDLLPLYQGQVAEGEVR